MGGTVAGLAFIPPSRTLPELKSIRDSPNFILVPGGIDPKDGVPPISALFYDRGAAVTVLHSHGNAEDLVDIEGTLQSISQELNVNVLGYDYRGYGLSSGTCDEAACCCAVRACFGYLMQRGTNGSSIILMGRSLGTGPTVDLAGREAGIAGVVLQSPLLSVLQTALSEPLARAMQKADLFDNAQKISAVSCPVFVIHGMDDRIVPKRHGEEICRRAPNAIRPWWVEGCGHNDLHHHQDFYRKLGEFFQFVQARQRRRWEDTTKKFSGSMVVHKKSTEKLLLTAL